MDPAGHASPGYAEWEAAEARRLDRLDRIGTQPEQQAGQQEDALDSPPRAHGYDQTSTGSEPSSGSEGTSPVRSSYGRYLQARKVASPRRTPHAHERVGKSVFQAGGVTPPFDPPPFEQALREIQNGGGVSSWQGQGAIDGGGGAARSVRGNPFASDAAQGGSPGSGNALLGQSDEDPEPEEEVEAWGGHRQEGSGRAVARFTRDTEFQIPADDEGLASGDEDDELPAELQWIVPWVDRGMDMPEVEELCGAGSVAAQLEELACQEAPVLREGLSNLRTQILNLQDSTKWVGDPLGQTEEQTEQRGADQRALDFFAMFTVEVLQRVEQMDKKRERDRRQRELDGGGGGGGEWGDGGSPSVGGSPERGELAQGFHSRGNAQVAAAAQAALTPADVGYGGALGRTGIFVTHEGYLMKKTSSTPHRWQRKWFSVVTKENNGLVDSRTMQYYDKKPPAGRETEVEAAHGIILPIERQIEPYDKRKFRLRVRPADPNERVYCFQTDTPEECQKWMEMLSDESKPSASRRGGLGHNHQVFLDAAREWILEVYKKHKPGKLKDVDVLLAEWVGEEEELLEKIMEKYNPKTPPPEAPAGAVAGEGNLRRMLS